MPKTTTLTREIQLAKDALSDNKKACADLRHATRALVEEMAKRKAEKNSAR